MGCGSCQSPRFAMRSFDINRHVAASLSEVPQHFALLGLSVPAITCFAVCARYRRRNIRCIKRERYFPSMHFTVALPQARFECTSRKCALLGAPSLTCRSNLNSGSISVKRLVSVDANSRRSGFLPPHQSSAVSAPSLPPQNATNYTTLPANKKPPPKIGRDPPSIHQQPTTAGASPLSPLNGMEHKPIDQQPSQPLHDCQADNHNPNIPLSEQSISQYHSQLPSAVVTRKLSTCCHIVSYSTINRT